MALTSRPAVNDSARPGAYVLAVRWLPWLPWLHSDVALALSVAVFGVGYTAVYGEGEAHFRERDAFGYALTIVAAMALVGRQRWPVPVFVITLAATLAYVGRNYSTGAILLALLVALSTLAEGNHRRTAVAAAVTLSPSRWYVLPGSLRAGTTGAR